MLFKGVLLISLSFLISKSIGNLLSIFTENGDWLRRFLYELTVWLNLYIGYRLIHQKSLQKRFLKVGFVLDAFLLMVALVFNLLPAPRPIILHQFQLMFRELLLSPLYFVGFYFFMIKLPKPNSLS